MHKFLITAVLAISFSFGTVAALLEIEPLSDISQNKIESSQIHFAIFHAHETNDLALLNYALEHEDIETRTEKTAIKFWDFDTSNDRLVLMHCAWQEGITPLEYAIRLQNPDLVKLLISSGADCDSIRVVYKTWDYQGETLGYLSPDWNYSHTPLYVALILGNTEIIKLLLDGGASPEEIFKTKIISGHQGLRGNFAAIYSDIIYSAQMLTDDLNNDELSPLFGD